LRFSPARLLVVAALIAASPRAGLAQNDYRNLESGRPLRVTDATPTERYSLDLDLTTFRVERLSLGRYRLQYEPRIAYGILPRAEVSFRMPSFYRERSISPRGGVAGFGMGGEYQILMERQAIPAVALSAEAFIPAGPNALRTSYSAKGILTKTLAPGRIHLNASYGTFAVQKAGSGGVLAPPVIDGPCDFMVPETGPSIRAFCMAPNYSQQTATAAAAEEDPAIVTKGHWLAGAGVDKTFPLSSVLIAGDVVVEKYNGIGRDAEWTAEAGIRKQFTQFLVLDFAAGRRFTGISKAWFATAGSTITMSLKR
jgi:hypothetical protein